MSHLIQLRFTPGQTLELQAGVFMFLFQLRKSVTVAQQLKQQEYDKDF
jgi:hypothetical protein